MPGEEPGLFVQADELSCSHEGDILTEDDAVGTNEKERSRFWTGRDRAVEDVGRVEDGALSFVISEPDRDRLIKAVAMNDCVRQLAIQRSYERSMGPV